MSKQMIALLHPGEMGAAVGACLAARGHRVLWVAAGRSAATRKRAEAAGLEATESLEAALADAAIVLSVCPPHAALDVARAVAANAFRGIYVDANAISPATTREVGRIVEARAASFVDGGIIGPPPTAPGTTRLYVSGPKREDIAALFAETHLHAIALDGGIGAASALKMAYAAWTKGSTALIAAVCALAAAEGVEESLVTEWKVSQPSLPREAAAVPGKVRKAWRWVAEMEEIAASFAAAGLPDGFHLAAADIYARLADFKDSVAAPSLEEVTRSMRLQQAPTSPWRGRGGASHDASPERVKLTTAPPAPPSRG